MTDVLDVAIVGAGVSGVYSGFRLLSTNRDQRVEIFEGDDHVGGRLLSATPPGIPNMVAELGGMRILPSVQPRITKLLEELNAGTEDPAELIETYDFPVDDPDNIAFVRDIHLRLRDFEESPGAIPYNLSFQEEGKTAGKLVLDALEQIVPGITSKDLTEADRRQLAQETSFGGKPLYRQGFWQVLMRVMTSEAYQLAKIAGGYQSTLSNWNAADAIPWYLSDFGVSPDYKGFKKGFQQVPLTVAQRFEAVGGVVHTGARVVSFEPDGEVVSLKLVTSTGRAHRPCEASDSGDAPSRARAVGS